MFKHVDRVLQEAGTREMNVLFSPFQFDQQVENAMRRPPQTRGRGMSTECDLHSVTLSACTRCHPQPVPKGTGELQPRSPRRLETGRPHMRKKSINVARGDRPIVFTFAREGVAGPCRTAVASRGACRLP